MFGFGVSVGRLSGCQLALPELLPSVACQYNDPSPAVTAKTDTDVAYIQAPPKTPMEARKNLALALTQAWDLNADEQLWSRSRYEGVSPPRAMLDLFMEEIGAQVGPTVGPACMDWQTRYMAAYPGCKKLYDFKYSELGRKYREAQPDNVGIVQADLGEDMSHVPKGLLDFAIVTQVFEHVPHFWNAVPNLARLMADDGVIVFSVPFAYQYHAFPGDFYRYTPMALSHMFQSVGFSVCQMVSDGWRTLQMHALGLQMPDIDNQVDYLSQKRSMHSLLIGASNYGMILQKGNCTLDRLSLTNEIMQLELMNKSNNFFFWPQPMENFPFPKAATTKIPSP
jgi:SAM-dependent methyltransferase